MIIFSRIKRQLEGGIDVLSHDISVGTETFYAPSLMGKIIILGTLE
jgi:hypothetical protein